jgi:hypothetical protein
VVVPVTEVRPDDLGVRREDVERQAVGVEEDDRVEPQLPGRPDEGLDRRVGSGE